MKPWLKNRNDKSACVNVFSELLLTEKFRHYLPMNALSYYWAYIDFFILSVYTSYITFQPANVGPQDVPRTSPSNVPRTSPKDSIWPSRGRLNLTSWGRPEITSRGHPNMTFKGRPWEVDSGRSQNVLRTSPRGPSDAQTLMPQIFFNFSELIRLTKSI